ncbi:hypothetical protein H4R20_006588 [Coemansia guatemalensis]|uniref:COP9 signalosome complex subunit 6 n=1 Tax=Coemansia guatemalensis TaxID=2761395 RepID=A0A9W8HP71_9FUNG|nr:hypothetical protein H4R20_006588 [Coemansia guatemalensis]
MATWNLSTAVIHPLVLLNVSEHTTRVLALTKTGKSSVPPFVCGALLGLQTENRFEAFMSFEFLYEGASQGNGFATINPAHFSQRIQQMEEVFPDNTFIGWYAVNTDTTITPEIAKIHEQLIRQYPSALLMVFDAALADGAAENSATQGRGFSLPFSIYETRAPGRVDSQKLLWYVSGNSSDTPSEYYVEASTNREGVVMDDLIWASQLVPIQVQLDSGEAERVAVEHVQYVARPTNADMLNSDSNVPSVSLNASRMATFLVSLRNALDMLDRDIALLKTYVGDVISGKAVFDPEVLQLVQRVLSNRPVVLDDKFFDLAASQEETNFQLASYLASVTSVAGAVRDLSQRSNTALRHGRTKHAPYVNPVQSDGMFAWGPSMGDMMSAFGARGHSGRGHGRFSHI